MTFQTRFTSWGSTVGTRLMARDTVAVDTLARLAISRISIGFQWALPCGSASILRTIYAASQSFSPHWRARRLCLLPRPHGSVPATHGKTDRVLVRQRQNTNRGTRDRAWRIPVAPRDRGRRSGVRGRLWPAPLLPF